MIDLHIGIIIDNIDHWRKGIDEASKLPSIIAWKLNIQMDP